MRRLVVVPLAAFALAVPAPAPAIAQATGCPAADDVPTPTTVAAARRATLCLVNLERAARDLPIVHTRAPLRAVAKRYARTMMHHNFFAHTSPGGQTVRRRIAASGYGRPGREFTVGEVLAWGQDDGATPRSTVREWLLSPSHRDVLLDGRLLDAGIGVVFGAPAEVPPGTIAATYVVELGVLRQPDRRTSDDVAARAHPHRVVRPSSR